MSGTEISKESFIRMPVENKLDVLFDVIQNIHQCACENSDQIIALEKKVDKKRKFDTAVSAAAGTLAACLAFFVQWIVTTAHSQIK